MKKNFKQLTITILMMAMVVFFANFAPAKAATEVPISKITVPKTLAVKTGETKTIKVTVGPENTTSTIKVTWTVDAKGAFTASKGATSITVKGTAAGTGTISASIKEYNSAGKAIKAYSAKTTVTVSKSVALTGISLSKTSASLNKGGTLDLSVNYKPADTTDSKTVTWTSSNSSIASVSAGKVTAKAPGTATITAKVGNKTATCKITVKAPITSLSLSKTAVTVEIGKTAGLSVSFAPANTTDSKTVTWTSSNTKVATVSNGTIKGVAAGTATITAKMGSKSVTCKVTVKATAAKFVSAAACYDKLNAYRKSAKLGNLTKDAALEKVAQQRAKELVESFSHKRPNGESGLTLIKGNVYKGENIAKGQKNCDAVMTAWYNSEGHRANMLGKNYTKVGVAGYEYNGVIYWVMVFSS